ncbi:hypothetical protein CR513_03613, partial [Mucuna pruriens]
MCQPWCIGYPKLEQAQSYELKSALIHWWPKFHGFVGVDPHKHLKKFHGKRNLISNMVSNTQQFGVMAFATSKVVNEVVVVGNQRLENKIIELTSLVRKLAIGQHHMTTNNIQFQENVFSTSQNLQTQIGQLATIVNQLQSKGVVEVIEVQPPFSSIMQSLQPLVIIANKLQAEQKERLLQDLKKLRDFDEYPTKHSTLMFLLKKPPKDVALKFQVKDVSAQSEHLDLGEVVSAKPAPSHPHFHGGA